MKKIMLKKPVQTILCSITSDMNIIRVYSSLYNLPWIGSPGKFIIYSDRTDCGKHNFIINGHKSFDSNYISNSCAKCINITAFNCVAFGTKEYSDIDINEHD